MENKTTYYKFHKELSFSIKQSFPKLKKLKKEENYIAFYDLLTEVIPILRPYIIKTINIAIKKNHFPKNKYVTNDFVDQLFVETYRNIGKFSDEDEFNVWLYKKTNELLNDAITKEEFDDLFFYNIDDYSKQEWERMEETFTAESDGDLIMKEELSDISYYQIPYTLKDVFIENTEGELIKKIDETIHKDKIDRHLQLVLHNLPLQTQNLFELLTKQHLTVADIAEVLNLNISEVELLLDRVRILLKTSLINRF